MRVITLNELEFRKACNKLCVEILNSSFRPELIVTIATGGVFVADNMPFGKADRHIVDLKRGSSHQKEKFKIDRVLKILPYWLLDLLRIIEAKILELSIKDKLPDPVTLAAIRKSFGEDIDFNNKPILIVDDAVDSGKTLATVALAVRELAGSQADIRSASLVVTTKAPSIMPDYSLFNGDLLRFPWSKDFKG